LAILAVTFVVFLPSLNNDFVNWDDHLYVAENSQIYDLSPDGIKTMLREPVAGNHHPVTIFSLALNQNISQLDAGSYHLMNLLFHLLNTFLVFVFVYRLFNKNLVVAAVASFLFAVHPMHVESVAWISARKDVLYCCFYLFAIILYLEYIKNGFCLRE